MYRLFSLLAVAALLSACSTQEVFDQMVYSELQDVSLSSSDKVPAQKAVVIIGTKHVYHRTPFLIGSRTKFVVPGSFRFIKNKDLSESDNSQAQFRPNYQNNTDEYYYDAYMVDPGSYHLAYLRFKYIDSNVRIRAHNHGLEGPNQLPTYASFKVNAGDVTYIGSFEAKLRQPFAQFVHEKHPLSDYVIKNGLSRKRFLEVNIHDNYENAVAFLTKYHPTLQSKLQKRLALKGTHSKLNLAKALKKSLNEQTSVNKTQQQ